MQYTAFVICLSVKQQPIRLPYQCGLFYEPGVVVINVVVGSTDVVGSTVGVVVGCVVVCSVVVATVVVVSTVVVVATILRSTQYAISDHKDHRNSGKISKQLRDR